MERNLMNSDSNVKMEVKEEPEYIYVDESVSIHLLSELLCPIENCMATDFSKLFKKMNNLSLLNEGFVS